jgi:tRNA U34 5-methylaminomethyl-2-thiouridine-forming methyltransferase MnmC
MDLLSLQTTADGSMTFFSELFQEAFHSLHGAKQEAEAKFVIPAQIKEKAKKQDRVCILDVCYGLGYNSAAAIASLQNLQTSNTNIEIIALENNLSVPQTAIAQKLLDIWQHPIPEILKELVENLAIKRENLAMQLLIGDARQTIQQVPMQWADAIFLDPFSPPHCPQLWTVEFMQAIANRLKPDGYVVTYSCAAAVRMAMILAGLHVASTAPVGRRSPGTIAAFPQMTLPPLSIAEQELLQTRAAIPYRDLELIDDKSVILLRRQQEQQLSQLESGSSWRRRYPFDSQP